MAPQLGVTFRDLSCSWPMRAEPPKPGNLFCRAGPRAVQASRQMTAFGAAPGADEASDRAGQLFGQGPGEPKARQGAGVVEAGEGGDPVALEGEHEQGGGVRDRCVLIAQVEAEGGL